MPMKCIVTPLRGILPVVKAVNLEQTLTLQ